jgi:hypothetical protein
MQEGCPFENNKGIVVFIVLPFAQQKDVLGFIYHL